MTNRRPSLLQARGGPHAHAHSAYKLQHGHGHDQHLHRQYPHDAVSGPRPGEDKPDSDQRPDLRHRAAVPVIDQKPTDEASPSVASLVTEVIQTVSLVQIVDPHGSPLETLTRLAAPNTVIVDKDTGKTISASHPDHTPAPAAPGSGPEPSGGIQSSTSGAGPQAKATSIPFASASSPASLSPSAHFSPPPAAPSLGIGHNGTNFHYSVHNSTNSLFHAETRKNATSSSTKFSSTKLPLTSSTASAPPSSRLTSFSEVVASTVSSFEPLATDGAFGGVYGKDGTPSNTGGTQPTPSSSSNSTENALSPQQKQVIGGVVGGVAGAAFFLVLVLLALRYKRRQGNAALPAGQPPSESRGLPPTAAGGAPAGGDGSGGGGAMAERYGAAALASAFAGLAAKRSSASANSTETGERGFYRVSGKKLPSVLQVGGDGYSDPRSSFMSGTSDYYRGSQAFDPFEGAGARLQLGAPMRPHSGVPIVRSGPARAVVAEPNPFADPPKTPPANAPSPPMMRLRESPGRGSRFQEGI